LTIKAYVMVKIQVGKDKKVFDEIRNIRRIYSVKEVASVYGDYDFVVKVQAEDQKGLQAIVFDAIRQIPEVTETVTLIVVRSSEE